MISPRWQSVNQVFAEAIQMLPEHTVDISAGVGEIEILADPLLPRIFFSLLSLSFRLGGPALFDNSDDCPTGQRESYVDL